MDVFEVMGTCRAIRQLKPDPVPPELIDRVLWAATRAPSPGNSQGWDFVVVDDPGARRTIGAAVREAMVDRVAAMPRPDRTTRLMLDGTARLVATFDQAPVIVFVTGGVIYPPQAPREAFTWSALYPAAQNIVLAARALGLGSVFTTLHHVADRTIRDTLGIPDHVRIAATIPIGWPDDGVQFGPVSRRPVEDFVHRNRWEGDKRGIGI
jgi:nitroreductase